MAILYQYSVIDPGLVLDSSLLLWTLRSQPESPPLPPDYRGLYGVE
jgi:hypothetical protein